MKRARVVLASCLAAGLLAGGVGAIAASQRQAPFPHARHERLFPVCEGCHAGIITGDAGAMFPAPADCAQCHDGVRQKTVAYTPRGDRISNLRFSHPVHAEVTALQGDPITCQSCHAAVEGEPSRMNVGAPQPALCATCHTPVTRAHLDTAAVCSTCHVTLAQATSLPKTRLADFPRPPWHEGDDFLSSHGALARTSTASCAVCHAQETCARCHANADRVPAIATLAPDARVASLEEGKVAEYPVPPSHRSAEWALAHGVAARRDGASCANCHTRPSCTGCHLAAGGTSRTAIASLPAATPGAAPGVDPERVGSDVHPPDIATRHGTLASAAAMQCSQCHTPQTCSACHVGADSRQFHPANFVERHATDVFAGSGSCQSCHNTESFCRSCHVRSGIAASGAMNAAFHDAQPTWILAHGQAARTGMESCAACHRQSDCVRCHSAVGGWRVNPHGPGFPASRLASRNAASCQWCHTGAPGGRE